MKFHWLLLSFLSFLLFASPAEAGRLLFWRFESNQNRLIFSTDDRVQPRAQLIPDPTRVVIDLPGIVLGRSTVNQSVGGAITSVRAGQFDSQTARLVIELAPGYTVDPQQVKVRGLSPTQWTVDLPTPQRVALPTPSNRLTSPPPLPTEPQPQSTNTEPTSASSSSDKQLNSSDFQVTRNGLFVRLDRGSSSGIKVKRSRDRQTIDVELPNATLPNSLAGNSLTVNDYGVSDIQFEQTSTSPPLAKITMTVERDSPDWQAVYSKFGGLVLLPRGSINAAYSGNPSSVALNTSSNTAGQATVQSVELANNNTQLLIRSDRAIKGTGQWNAGSNTYEIRIPNAQLADPVRGPQLGRGSPVYKLRIRQEDPQNVVILVEPGLGIQFGQLAQPSASVLSLDLRALRNSTVSSTSGTSSNATPIFVPPPANATSVPPSLSTPSSASPPPTALPNVSGSGKLVVIDPGHGGKDPGAIGIGGLQEKNVVLPISLEITRLLQQQGVRVMMTRNSDYFVSLQGRADMANRARATVFVSIHANSVGLSRPEVNGLEVYYYGNRRLSDTIHRSILRTVNVRDRGVRQARFYVLRKTSMPATLVETGYVTGNVDANNLRNPTFQKQMAEAIARGILEYLQ